MASTIAGTTATTPDRDGYGPQGRSAWLDVDWREHLRWARIDGSAVNYVDIGKGDPLVFVHGLSGSWQNWLENIPHFAASRRVIALDLPGFGNSEMPVRDKISIAGYAAVVDALLDHLGIETTAVVGNSMGGFIGAELAIEFATRVEKLVLVSAAGISSQDLHNDLVLSGLRRVQNVLAATTGWTASKADVFARRPGLRRQLFGIVAAHPGRLPGPLVAEQLKGSGKPGFLDALEALGTYPIEDRLERIECPTLVVWGDRDKLVPVRDADRFIDAIGPNARKIVYADTGHVSMLERPARFNADVEAFLDEPVEPGDAQ
jgi:pimeloyl-ACP methyl ester carboxylesterase